MALPSGDLLPLRVKAQQGGGQAIDLLALFEPLG